MRTVLRYGWPAIVAAVFGIAIWTVLLLQWRDCSARLGAFIRSLIGYACVDAR